MWEGITAALVPIVLHERVAALYNAGEWKEHSTVRTMTPHLRHIILLSSAVAVCFARPQEPAPAAPAPAAPAPAAPAPAAPAAPSAAPAAAPLDAISSSVSTAGTSLSPTYL